MKILIVDIFKKYRLSTNLPNSNSPLHYLLPLEATSLLIFTINYKISWSLLAVSSTLPSVHQFHRP